MNREQLDQIFGSQIFPGFPFRREDWIAVAFERNRYDNTRLPQQFFESASQHFSSPRNRSLFVSGDLFDNGKIARVDFKWQEYRSFMLSPDSFSLEYKIFSENLSCACWADEEITIFGGSPAQMNAVMDDYGGRDSFLSTMEDEFFLKSREGNSDMRHYLAGLLFPEQRR